MKIGKMALRQYIEFLKELESADPYSDSVEFELWFPHSQPFAIREMIGPDYQTLPREAAKQSLKARLRDAEKLIICDRYIFNIPPETIESEYARQLVSVLPTKTLRQLDIVYGGRKSVSIVQELKKRLPRNVTLRLFANDSVHDRVWIVNENKAFTVGTSFGGIGKRVAFMLDLSDDDLADFKKHLAKFLKSN